MTGEDYKLLVSFDSPAGTGDIALALLFEDRITAFVLFDTRSGSERKLKIWMDLLTNPV